METPDVLVIGTRVIGCSLARELVRAKQKVVVVEHDQIGSGASSAAAGLLAPALSTPRIVKEFSRLPEHEAAEV